MLKKGKLTIVVVAVVIVAKYYVRRVLTEYFTTYVS